MQNVLKIDLELDVLSNGRPYSVVQKQMDDFMVQLRAAKTGKLSTLNVQGMNSHFKSLIEQNVQKVCKNGSVFEMNKEKKEQCRKYPAVQQLIKIFD